MSASGIDNPVWSSLHSRHRDIALREGDAVRYPPGYAPFLAVANADCDVAEAIASLVAPGETVYLLGIPPLVSDGWSLKAYRPLAQMVCADPIEAIDGPEVIELSEVHRPDVMTLTALVYPHYFRPRTIELGRYFGIYQDGGLAAMIGERLGTDGHTEISAICTHPDFNGRGLARRLIALLTNDVLAQGQTPFLHVSRENRRALELYERIGYSHRPGIGFWSLRRESVG